jgi:prophage tail gpP-like protein
MTLSLTKLPLPTVSDDVVITGTPLKRDPDEVYLLVGDRQLAGWEEIAITLRAEGFPNSFSVSLSSADPIDNQPIVPRAGDKCSVQIGNDLVITGYVDRDSESGNDTTHTIALTGRGMTQDLVDCSAEWESGQIIRGNALQIAEKLVLPYGIKVELGPGAKVGPEAIGWNLNYGETAAEIIQKFARNAGLLAYEDPRGHLILGTVGVVRAASGVVYGKNVQAWSAENSMDGRYSEIVCCAESMNALSDLPGSDFYDKATDPNVPRHRLLYVVVENVAADPREFTSTKAKWDAARRAGRAAVVHATVDSWRDKDGKLWAPNTLVPIDLPGNRAGKELVVGEVVFRRSSDSGTTADLMLMPRAAFVPEPIVINPVNTADIAPASPTPAPTP